MHLIAAVMTTVFAAEPVEIVAHRGASFDAPENTVAAIRLAWEQGADASEFDVYLASDGKIVVTHDADTKRVAGVAMKVAATPSAALHLLDVGAWKGAKFAGEKLPTLEEMLATVPKGKRVFIEVKCGPEIVPELKRVLAACKLPPEQTPVISFSAAVVAAVKKDIPALKAYWLASVKKDTTADTLIATAKRVEADGLNLSAGPFIDKAFVDRAKAEGLPVYVWTVNDPKMARAMIAAGVTAITTDRPGWMREQLKAE